jgi:hypothetical protein
MKKMTVTIASVPDRDNLVAELWCENDLWGELSQEQGELKLDIYPAPNAQNWHLNYEELIGIIQESKEKLLGQITHSNHTYPKHITSKPLAINMRSFGR